MNTPKTYTLTFTDQDLQILAQALEQMPFKYASPLFNKINTQLQEQSALPPVQD